MQKVIAEKRIIGGRECFIYDCGSPDTLLIQPVDDHDIEVLDSEVNRICELVNGAATWPDKRPGKRLHAGSLQGKRLEHRPLPMGGGAGIRRCRLRQRGGGYHEVYPRVADT